jgi:hypothetical protein
MQPTIYLKNALLMSCVLTACDDNEQHCVAVLPTNSSAPADPKAATGWIERDVEWDDL